MVQWRHQAYKWPRLEVQRLNEHNLTVLSHLGHKRLMLSPSGLIYVSGILAKRWIFKSQLLPLHDGQRPCQHLHS